MAAQSRSSVYASAPFKFIVEGEPLYIHSDLVSLHSKPLDRMIHAPMAEAQKGFATLEDVDDGTFVRFIEWAHKGYYTAAEFTTDEARSSRTSGNQNHDEVVPTTQEADFPGETIRLASEENFDFAPVIEAEPEPEPMSWDAPLASSYKKGKKVKKVIHFDRLDQKGGLKESFISRRYTVRQSAVEIPPPRPNHHPEEDYTDVFLSHVQLYVFADAYDIQPLRVLALEELHATLAIHTLYPERTGDIIALLRYVYANTRKLREGVEDVRNLVTQYVGYEMGMLIRDPAFGDLIIKDGGDLLGDILRMLGQRTS